MPVCPSFVAAHVHPYQHAVRIVIHCHSAEFPRYRRRRRAQEGVRNVPGASSSFCQRQARKPNPPVRKHGLSARSPEISAVHRSDSCQPLWRTRSIFASLATVIENAGLPIRRRSGAVGCSKLGVALSGIASGVCGTVGLRPNGVHESGTFTCRVYLAQVFLCATDTIALSEGAGFTAGA